MSAMLQYEIRDFWNHNPCVGGSSPSSATKSAAHFSQPNQSDNRRLTPAWHDARMTAAEAASAGEDRSPAPEFWITLYPDGRIRRADKAITRILGWRPEQIFGLPLSHLLPFDAQSRMELLWENDGFLNGLTLPKVPLRHANGAGYINFDMQVSVDEASGDRRLDVFKPAQESAAEEPMEEPLGTEEFFDFVDSVVRGEGDGAKDLAMVDVAGLREGGLGAKLGAEKEAALTAGIEAAIRDKALDGKVGKIDEAAYAFLTEDSFDREELERELAAAAKQLQVNADDLGLKTKGLEIDQRDLDSDTLKQALNHARGVFLGEIDGRDDQTLSDVIDGVEHHRRLIRDALDAHKHRTTPREVRDGRTNVRLAVLHQPKVLIDNRIRFADELIVLRDHPDLAAKHDLTIFAEFLRLRTLAEDKERRVPGMFELCFVNLKNAEYISEIIDLFRSKKIRPGEIGFRIRLMPSLRGGGAAWDGFRRLARAGFPLWIDRFGDVVTDEDLMHQVTGGMVELSARTLDRIAAHPEGKALTIRLIETWRRKGVTLLSADLVKYERKELAQKLGLTVALADPVDG